MYSYDCRCGFTPGVFRRRMGVKGRSRQGDIYIDVMGDPLRVKWGAGANPALAGVAVGLERAGAAAGARAARLARAGGALAPHARAAAAQRAARARARQHHALHTALLHWEKACTLARKYELSVTPVQESLMEMLHPEGNIDTQWVSYFYLHLYYT